MSRPTLPYELIEQIIDEIYLLKDSSTLANLARTSMMFYTIVTPLIFDYVLLKDSKGFNAFYGLFKRSVNPFTIADGSYKNFNYPSIRSLTFQETTAVVKRLVDIDCQVKPARNNSLSNTSAVHNSLAHLLGPHGALRPYFKCDLIQTFSIGTENWMLPLFGIIEWILLAPSLYSAWHVEPLEDDSIWEESYANLFFIHTDDMLRDETLLAAEYDYRHFTTSAVYFDLAQTWFPNNPADFSGSIPIAPFYCLKSLSISIATSSLAIIIGAIVCTRNFPVLKNLKIKLKYIYTRTSLMKEYEFELLCYACRFSGLRLSKFKSIPESTYPLECPMVLEAVQIFEERLKTVEAVYDGPTFDSCRISGRGVEFTVLY